MKNRVSNALPWKEILEAGEKFEPAWTVAPMRVLRGITDLQLTPEELGEGEELPQSAFDRISDIIDREMENIDHLDYYLRLSLRFSHYHLLAGFFLGQITGREEDAVRQALMQVSHIILVRSVMQQTFTVETWRGLVSQLPESQQPIFSTIINRVEKSVMKNTGNSVYCFFEDRCLKMEIDTLLEEAYKSLQAEEQARRYTVRHGEGHTKLILQYVEMWQEEGKMKELPRIMPFLKSLSAYWNHEFKLGCRQGAERMYVKKFLSAY